MRHLKVDLEESGSGLWYFWINGPWITIEDRFGYKSKAKAKAAAEQFINRCLTDREIWPEEYK